MAQPKKRKSSNTRHKYNKIIMFFSKTPEPSKSTEWEARRGTEVQEKEQIEGREAQDYLYVMSGAY